MDVKQFVQDNVVPYDGGPGFLSGPTENTTKLWDRCRELLKEERDNGGVLDIDTGTISQIDSHPPGYIDKEREKIVGLQTDAPLKRAIKPFGGIRVVQKACEQNGREVDPEVVEICTKYRKTHNDGVFDAYPEKSRLLRKVGVITGLPDNYARGRIIGDHRRVALYGIDRLIEEKKKDKKKYEGKMTDECIRLREEIADQIQALKLMKTMAAGYGSDISRPACGAQEAVQWVYFAYLAAVKEYDGAAMSFGNMSTFLDIFIEKDLQDGKITEPEAQELIDQLVIKLRLVRHLRADEYNQLFAGDPTWVTEAIGGCFENGNHKITKTSYRFLQTLYNLGPAPEPNITILWDDNLPDAFKKFCAKVSIDTSSIQYENDALMRKHWGSDDYGIACCVSCTKTGRGMQYFGARCNLGKALLLALNAGKDEVTGRVVFEGIEPLPESDEYLDDREVKKRFIKVRSKLVEHYVNTMNVIHFMHDKYFYERAQMALIDTDVERSMAFGMAGLSVVADSLSGINHANVKPLRNEDGIIEDFEIEGDFPKFGNDDDRVDDIAVQLVQDFNEELKQHRIYRDAMPTLSILTITSNVVYGKKTGSTPDGRKAGEPFAPGANPMHGRDSSGAVAALNSVAKLPYESCMDGISKTFSIVPGTLGAEEEEQQTNLVNLLGGYFNRNAHHLNVNVLERRKLEEAMENPEKYPQLTIRVSGYAVNFNKLTRDQQKEVIERTFH